MITVHNKTIKKISLFTERWRLYQLDFIDIVRSFRLKSYEVLVIKNDRTFQSVIYIINLKKNFLWIPKMFVYLILILSDEDFILLKAQCKDTFNKLFQQNKNDIYNFLLIKLRGDYHTANDLISETFISAYNSTPKLEENKNLKSWLLKIAHRRLIDEQRKHFREKKYQQIHQENVPHSEDFEESIHKKQKALLFSMAMKQINPEYQQVLTMRYKEEKSIKQIASILEKDETNVNNRIYRAKVALKKEMAKISEDFFEENR